MKELIESKNALNLPPPCAFNTVWVQEANGSFLLVGKKQATVSPGWEYKHGHLRPLLVLGVWPEVCAGLRHMSGSRGSCGASQSEGSTEILLAAREDVRSLV